ncbi:DAG7 [Sanghuangporus vaninii]
MVMSSFSKVLVLFSLAISVSGLATPHVLRSPHGHHALAARMANPAPSPAVGPYGREVKVVKPRRKRGDTGRCRAQTQTSSAAPSSSSSEAPQPTSSAEPVAAVAASPSSSSSSTPAPSPETSSTPAPSPEPTTSTSEAPAPASTTSDSGSSNSGGSNSNQPSFLVGTQTGQGTYYDIGLGACGITNSGDDRIAAVSHLLFDQFPGYDEVNPNSNPVCGKSITATYQGKSTTVTVTDRCVGCSETDLDFSPRAFEDLANFSVGRLSGMTWVWNN